MTKSVSQEQKRLDEHYTEKKKWLKWGPYLSERQWGTVREDYSANGDAWNYITHSFSRSKAYRWGEDGIAGLSDEKARLCFAPAFWNGKDTILKERLFGLTPSQSNHGEDVKELYYYLDNTPSHSFMKYLYKYPQDQFPYELLETTNSRLKKKDPEFEITDTGIFNNNRYFDIFIEYAKNDTEDICIKITVHNRAAEKAFLVVLPTLWFRNEWSVGLISEKPDIQLGTSNDDYGTAVATDSRLGAYNFYFQKPERVLFTENEDNFERLYALMNKTPFVKDSFHDAVVHNHFDIFNGKKNGTKFAPLYRLMLDAGAETVIKLRLSKESISQPFGTDFEKIFSQRIAEADEFYNSLTANESEDIRNIQRQAYAGLLWNKQFYYIDIPSWLKGDPGHVPPPASRLTGRNSEWPTLNNEDIISMPDKWEYPWYAAWDLPFHCIPLASLDAEFVKGQLILLLREWYMNPYGQIPAYEWNFSDVNPPVQAWACMQVYKIDKARTGKGDICFLERVFQKLLINFTWWVNRKDHLNNNVFEGGFLGMDNIGIFDRNNVPGGGILEQADGTAWMGMYCLNMLEIALELAQYNKTYEDLATKFFEHFTYIAASINQIREGFEGSWDEEEGFFYDVLRLPDGSFKPLKVRSLVGLTSLFAVHVIDKQLLEKVPEFYGRLKWFVQYRQKNDEYQVIENLGDSEHILLSLAPFKRLQKILCALLDEQEFLSCAGIRSLSKIHEKPYSININGYDFGLHYEPGDSETAIFGGNSNWRGPVWMPMNFLIIRSLEKYYHYFGDDYKVEFPNRSGNLMNLHQVASALRNRLIGIFKQDDKGNRIANGDNHLFNQDPYFKDLVLFHEFFHGDSGKGLGASHQTGWTGVIAEMIRIMSDE
ncbi:MAG: glucosidase [Chitinophagaceae bacterium]|nr:glucosidase [Chitinophagaceae bacterium]